MLPVAEALRTSDSQSSAQTLTTAVGTSAGDTLAIIYGSDAGTLAGMPDPTSTAGTPAFVVSADMGSGSGHIKAYLCAVTTGGSKDVTIPANGGNDVFGVVVRISATVTADVSGSNADAASTSSHVAPSLVTTGADRLLICAWTVAGVFSSFGASPYTLPGGMTDRGQPIASPFSALCAATEPITSAGATGTRTATFALSKPYCALSMAVAAAGGGSSTPPRRSGSRRMQSLLVR